MFHIIEHVMTHNEPEIIFDIFLIIVEYGVMWIQSGFWMDGHELRWRSAPSECFSSFKYIFKFSSFFWDQDGHLVLFKTPVPDGTHLRSMHEPTAHDGRV